MFDVYKIFTQWVIVSADNVLPENFFLTYSTYLTYSILLYNHVYIVFIFLFKLTIFRPYGCPVFLVK